MSIDLALFKPATASSVLNANSTPDLAFDNNQFTGWCPASVSVPQWISVDLGSAQSIGEIVLRWYQDMWPKAYIIEVSLDAATWSTIYSTTAATVTAGPNSLSVMDLTGLVGTGRYVRLTATVPNGSYYSLHDWFIYAVVAVAAPTINTPAVIPGTPQVGTPITATDATWNGTVVSRAYQWKAAGTNAAGAGATTLTYTPASGDLAKTLTITVAATNNGGTSLPSTSAPSAPVIARQTGTTWGWRENFATPPIYPWAKSYNIYASGDTTSPLGPISSPSGFYGLFTGPDASGYEQMASTFFGQKPDAGADFVVPPYPPYPGVFTQSLKFYYPGPTGLGAWAPQPDQTKIAFQLNSDPNEDTGGDFALETDINFCVRAAKPNQLELTFAYGWAELYLDHVYLGANPMITTPGWYTINQTYMKTGNMTTDAGLCIIGVYDASGNLVTYFLRAGGAIAPDDVPIVTSTTDIRSGNHLQGPSSMWIGFFQPAFAGGSLALTDIGWYLGHPSASRPVISNGYQATGAHGQPFSLQIAAPGATSYSVIGLPAGLTVNTTTGLISGAPAAAGTKQIIVAASNATGVDAVRINLVVS
jgi:hypothetical protein